MQFTTNQKNILAMYLQANEQEQFTGLNWYQSAHDIACRISEKFNVEFWKAAGVIAALSPRNKWERNVMDAEALIQAYVRELDISAVKVCTFNANKHKAWEIMNTASDVASVSRILKGNKVVSFYNNILFPTCAEYVTIDGHAVCIWFGVRYALGKISTITDNQYKRISNDYRVVAEHLNIRPCQLQAITWTVYRNMQEQTTQR